MTGALDSRQQEKRFEEAKENNGTFDTALNADQLISIQSGNKAMPLAGIAVRGLNQFQAIDLLPLYEQYLGVNIEVETLRVIANRITEFYRERGYPAALAVVPGQNISNGIAYIDLSEGVISRIRVIGDIRGNSRYLEAYFNDIRLDQAIDRKALIAASLRLNDLPGLSATTHIQALENGKPGQLELVVVVRQKRFSGDLESDNRGSKVLGKNQGLLSLTSVSALGLFESIKFKTAQTINDHELSYYGLNTRWPIGHRGLQLKFNGSYVDSEPGAFLAPLDIEVRSTSGSGGLMYPLIRGYNRSLYANAQINYYQSKAEVGKDFSVSDEIYSLQMALDYVLIDTNISYSRYSVGVRQGLSGLNKTQLITEEGGESRGQEKFSVAQLSAFYRRVLIDRWSLVLKINGQYASRGLPPSQRFAFGGKSMGGAYDPAELIGDHGIAGRAKMQYLVQRALLPRTQTRLYSYYDIGRLWNIDQHERASAASVGLGVETFAKHLSSSLEIAKPLTRSVFQEANHGSRARVFASVKYHF
ncbi:MAG: hypothetical protein KUG71_12400 [Porticoccaceae bacterium]|nr:hypothetical protein [Porticoccaceae bacterium]